MFNYNNARNNTRSNNDIPRNVLFKDYASLRLVGGRISASDFMDLYLACDSSGSSNRPMEGTSSRFDGIKQALLHHLRDLMKDELWLAYGHVSILVFGDDKTHLILDRTPVCELDLDSVKKELDAVRPRGNTPMGRALVEAMTQLRESHKQAAAKGMNAYQPILVLFTDGEANDDMSKAFRMADDLLGKGKLLLLPVHISNCQEGIDTLERLVAKDPGEGVSILNNRSDVHGFFQYLKKTEQILHDNDPEKVAKARQELQQAKFTYITTKGV